MNFPEIPDKPEKDMKWRFQAGNKWASLQAKFQSVEQFQEAAMEYFEIAKQKNGVYKPTLTGLAFHCGFASTKSLKDLEKKPEFTYAVQRALLFVQSCYEANLYGFSWGGASFALKNLGRGEWTDESIQHQTQLITEVKPVIIDSGIPLGDSEDNV